MVVCIATDSFPPALGGIATFYANLCELLTGKGDLPIVLMADAHADSGEDDLVIKEGLLTKIILRKTYLKYYNYYKAYFRPGGLNAPYWLALGFSMRDWLLQNHKRFQIDIIDTIDYGGLGVFLVDDELPPVVVTAHGTLTQYSRVNLHARDDHYKAITQLERLSIAAADSILAYSWSNKKDLESVFQKNIAFSTAPWLYRNLKDHPVATNGNAVTVAGLQKIKGAELLTEALSIVADSLPGFQCEWIGMDFYSSPEYGSMDLYLQKKFPDVWNKHILWKNGLEREATIKKIANASFEIIPSLFETFSYVSLEAATLGKAILITETTGASYLFTHNENAWIVSAEAKEMAEAIIHLNNHPELCARLGANAKKMIEVAFEENALYTERLQKYQEAIRARKERNAVPPHLGFLKQYTTAFRKSYYQTRAFMKKLVKGS